MDIKRNLIGLLLFAFSIFVLSSCSGDYFGNNDRVEGDEVRLDMSVGLDTDLQAEPGIENSVKSVRVMIFVSTESQNAGVPPGCVLINKRYDNPNEIPTQRFSPGLRDVYVVANETARMRTQLDKVTSVRQLQAINVEYDPAVPSVGKPFVMCAEHRNKRFDGGTTESLSLGLLRIAAKAHFKLNFDALATGIDVGLVDRPLIVDSVRIMQISDSTMLSSSAPVYVPQKQVASPLLVLAQPTNPKNWTISGDLYLTERLFAQGESTSDPEQATHMIVYAKLDGTACRYRINIGNVASKGVPTKNYTITRNTQYNITGTITKVGEVDGVDVVIDIAPWWTITDESNVGDKYFSFSYMNTQDGSYALNDGGYVVSGGEVIRFICSTNVGKWYVVVTDSKNKLICKSDPTAPVSSSQPQYVEIAFPSITGKETYKIKFYAPLVAPTVAGPLKTLTLNQNDGVLPNSVLIKESPYGNLTPFPGWPLDKLPKGGGLQVATLNASGEDPLAKWSNEYYETGANKYTCGFGESNTAVLVKRGIGKYPAAKICTDLGPGWYLPSTYELINIKVHQDYLRSVHALTPNTYWCGSEGGDNDAWYVNFGPVGSGGSFAGTQFKDSSLRVRCVKNM